MEQQREPFLPLLSAQNGRKREEKSHLKYFFFCLLLLICLVAIQLLAAPAHLATRSQPKPAPKLAKLPALPERQNHSLTFLKKYYEQQADDRRAEFNKISEGANFEVLYAVLVPEVFCQNAIRVGRVGDGGKWVCNPEAMPKTNCSIYSLGLRNEISFDQEIQGFNNKGCKIYGYDVEVQADKLHQEYAAINGKLGAVRISDRTNEALSEWTLGDLVKLNSDPIEMLKCDIEGAEMTVLPAFLAEFSPCQLFFELHSNAFGMKELIKKVADKDYRLFHYEINGGGLTFCEFGFIHEKCLEKYSAVKLAYYLNSMENI